MHTLTASSWHQFRASREEEEEEEEDDDDVISASLPGREQTAIDCRGS